MQQMNQALYLLRQYADDLGNHKTRATTDPRIWAIVRKSKQYGFSMDFGKLESLGFKAIKLHTYEGKEEIVIQYVGN